MLAWLLAIALAVAEPMDAPPELLGIWNVALTTTEASCAAYAPGTEVGQVWTLVDDQGCIKVQVASATPTAGELLGCLEEDGKTLGLFHFGASATVTANLTWDAKTLTGTRLVANRSAKRQDESSGPCAIAYELSATKQ